MKQQYDYYSFKVDGGLSVCSRAPSEEKARERIARCWPRSRIELMGINLPSAQRVKLQEPSQSNIPTQASIVTRDPFAAPARPKNDGRQQNDYASAINAAIQDS